MQQNSTTVSAKKSAKRILAQKPFDLFLLMAVRPHKLLKSVGWRILGKKLRARSQIETAIETLPLSRLRQYRNFGKSEYALTKAIISAATSPKIGVHLHIAGAHKLDEALQAIKSIQCQNTAAYRIYVTGSSEVSLDIPWNPETEFLDGEFANSAHALLSALERAQSEKIAWLVPLEPEFRLSRHALTFFHAMLCNMQGNSNESFAAILYGDEAAIATPQLFSKAWLKPQWDGRMILSQDYISRACAFSVEKALGVWKQSGGRKPKSLYEWVLRIGEGHRVEHVPRIVALTPLHSWREDTDQKLETVREIVNCKGAEVSPGPFGTTKLRFPLPKPLPKISVIIATRDRVELLRTCVEGVLRDTDYQELEVIIADNDSVEPETLTYLDKVAADPRARVVRWPHPFNYSAINNFAAKHASGEYICLLNNDIEVLDPHWLSAMVREASRPRVGAVGARLLYPDRSIQHAGVAIGIGNAAGHAHRGLAENEPGYFAQVHITRGASAVTGACLLVAKRYFDEVGGLDEEYLAIAYNDVDLCLKLQELGLTNIYTPEATLMHHESKSRGSDFDPKHIVRYKAELKVFQERWGTEHIVDPWHHPNLDRDSEVFGNSH